MKRLPLLVMVALVVAGLTSTSSYLVLSSESASELQLTEKAAIHGTVYLAGGRQVIENVRVWLLETPESVLDVTGRDSEVIVSSDASGRFAFTGLTAGSYDLGVIRPGDPRERRLQIRRIQLQASGPPPDLSLWITPYARLSGRVLQADGEPARGARVRVLEEEWVEGGRRFVEVEGVAATVSDDLGQYVLDLPYGEYYLLITRDDGVRQYYPGVVHPEEAIAIELGRPGSEGVNILLRDEPQYTVRFRWVAREDLPGLADAIARRAANGSVPLRAWARPLGLGVIQSPAYEIDLRLEDGSTGTYTTVLTEGRYDVLFRYEDDVIRGLVPEIARASIDPAAIVDLDVSEGGLVRPLVIRHTPFASVSGVIAKIGGPASAIERLPNIVLTESTFGHGRISAWVDATTFVLEAVPPGLYGIGLVGVLPSDLYVREVRSGSRNVLEDGLLITSGLGVPIVQVVLAEGRARLGGTVKNSAGALVAGAYVVAIPPPENRGPFRHVPMATVDDNGRYSFDRLSPGEYRVVAIESLGSRVDAESMSPSFLREYETRGRRISVDPGTMNTVDLEVLR